MSAILHAINESIENDRWRIHIGEWRVKCLNDASYWMAKYQSEVKRGKNKNKKFNKLKRDHEMLLILAQDIHGNLSYATETLQQQLDDSQNAIDTLNRAKADSIQTAIDALGDAIQAGDQL